MKSDASLPTPDIAAQSAEIWIRLANTAAGERLEDYRECHAPVGFPTRVVALWREWDREERFRLWRRWSLAGSFVSAGTALILIVGPSPTPPPSSVGPPGSNPVNSLPLLEPLTLSIPLP